MQYGPKSTDEIIRYAPKALRSSSLLFIHDASQFPTNQLKQETQLSLTNRATRLEVSQGHQTWYNSMC